MILSLIPTSELSSKKKLKGWWIDGYPISSISEGVRTNSTILVGRNRMLSNTIKIKWNHWAWDRRKRSNHFLWPCALLRCKTVCPPLQIMCPSLCKSCALLLCKTMCPPLQIVCPSLCKSSSKSKPAREWSWVRGLWSNTVDSKSTPVHEWWSWVHGLWINMVDCVWTRWSRPCERRILSFCFEMKVLCF